ncbi:class I SAM-dependent methyltransferase [Cloacibacillus evryensis]|uniref:class I SAM-dependent methyltransferase n=1 Tax=Cloacibacillus evryensis TaxID=508460 RepID=UPI002672FE8B|nr:class I SAM-dependent methyltransferase [Cloacibacillus evryensis]
MLKALFKNCGKPQGVLGKLMLHGMNAGHGTLSEWGLSQIRIPAGANVLDIGCGGGANLLRLAKLAARGTVCGIDISECSLECSRKKVREYIAEGRCQVKYGSAEEIPFPDGFFAVVTAFETVYFWKDMAAALREVRRVLREDGLFMVVNDQSDAQNNCWAGIVEGMTVRGGDELRALFEEAGFIGTEVISEDDGRLCVIGRSK